MKKVVVTSFDSNYMGYSRVAIKSLGMNYHGDTPLEVVCLVPESIMGLEDDYRMSVAQDNLRIRFMISEKFLKLDKDGYARGVQHVTPNAYQRIFIGSLFPEYDFAIYIDPDTIILRDISPLLDYSGSGTFFAVMETVNNSKRLFNNSDVPCFNSGVFIADLEFWRSNSIEDKLVEWITHNPDTQFAEQDSLNAILAKHLSPLPFSFNFFDWIIGNNKLMAKEYDDPLIVHFAGYQKPWAGESTSIYADLWRSVYKDFKPMLLGTV
jgi:lipopolysaccharide biosynthesis glycosyltransferase